MPLGLQRLEALQLVVRQQAADGVIDLQLDYLIEGGSAYVAASAVTDWNAVTGVRMRLTIEEPDRPAAVTDRVRRTMTHVVTLRNRIESPVRIHAVSPVSIAPLSPTMPPNALE